MATTAPELETNSLPANAYQPLNGELHVPLVPTSVSRPTGQQLTGNLGPVPIGMGFPQVRQQFRMFVQQPKQI